MEKNRDDINWQEIDDHFHKVINLPADQRERYFNDLYADSPEIAVETRKLLEAHMKAGLFLEMGVLDEISEMAGRVIGPWKIIRELGRGGMSTVYLAERTDGSFERKVAVKFLYGFLPGPQLRARMMAEQRILAQLEHPNIAMLLDAGITEEGRPYFILEHVDGCSITEYCDQNELDLKARITLFEQVCEAVHHAHQRLIIHRDLKPSNIMVNRDGQVKMLDFGIAKMLEEHPGEPQFVTRTGFTVMTPEYASPEQIRNTHITTSTDCYTLGLLLCELLTGSLPYEVKGKSPFEIGRIITDTEPRKPSTLQTETFSGSPSDRRSEMWYDGDEAGGGSKTQGPGPNAMSKKPWIGKLRGDLENIILKAIRKEPERRYGSVRELMQDLRNYRMDLPVSARRETLGYLAGKFIQRHKTAVVAASLAGMLLVLSTFFSMWQASVAREQKFIAEQRFGDVRQLANSVLFEFHDAIADLPGSTTARELLVERALDYLDMLSVQHQSDSGLNSELAAAYLKVGNVQGNPTNANLGRPGDALTSYEKGKKLVQQVLKQEPDHLEALAIQADLIGRMADLHAVLGDRELSENLAFESTNQYRRLVDRHPNDARLVAEYAISLIKYGDLLGNPNMINLGEKQRALEQYHAAESSLSSLFNRSWDAALAAEDQGELNANLVRLLGVVYERIGNILEEENDLEGAMEVFRKSMEYRKFVVEMNPLMTDAIRDEAVAYEKLGKVYWKNTQLDEALYHLEKSFEIFRWLVDADPRNIQARQSLAISHIHMGDISFQPDRPGFNDRGRAEMHFKESQDLLNDLAIADPGNTRVTELIGMVGRRLQNLEAGSRNRTTDGVDVLPSDHPVP